MTAQWLRERLPQHRVELIRRAAMGARPITWPKSNCGKTPPVPGAICEAICSLDLRESVDTRILAMAQTPAPSIAAQQTPAHDIF